MGNARPSPSRSPLGAKTFKICFLNIWNYKARGRGNDAPSRAPRSTTSFKIKAKTMDSKARGRGNDASKQAPRITKSYKILSKTMFKSSCYLVLVLFFSCPHPFISSSCYVCPPCAIIRLVLGFDFLMFSCRLNIMKIHGLVEALSPH